MQNTPFHTYWTAQQLSNLADSKVFLPVFSSSSIGIYPYQIAAANFAMRSQYVKGCILCDEGSLGKTYEALLIAAQRWYEGKDRLLLVLPINLVGQWIRKIESGFTLPYVIWNTENDNGGAIPESDGITITTYDFAYRFADVIASQTWDMVIFDEADVLFKPENKTVSTLKTATAGTFKLLLTPTPITMSVMDIYGLIHFIDETVLLEADDFYKRYFRKPENYPELTAWVSQFAFRTLKSQVTEYVNFTERLPITMDYSLTPAEKRLYEQVGAYLAVSKKAAYPNMDGYELSLMFYHILSSSPKAFAKTIDGALSRLANEDEKVQKERTQLTEIKAMVDNIGESGKMKALLIALKSCLAHMKRLKLNQKAIVFVDNLTTLALLKDLLGEHGYNVITNAATDHIERFRYEKAAVLLATDTAAKGLDMEFCPLVINYDMLFNAVEMEQRISRCHRQGQTSDVVVVNLLSQENLSDVRILELINKRVSQFDGIFGMSDDMVGSFDLDTDGILTKIRKPDEIQKAFTQNLTTHETQNKRLIANAEDTLFTTFTKAVADKVEVTPKYIEARSAEINADLWELAKLYFAERGDYEVDEQTQTVTLTADKAPKMFYYWTGSRNRPHNGLKQYGISQDFKPHHGRITLISPIGKGILSEINCSMSGTITVDADIESCEIGYFQVSIYTTGSIMKASYYTFVGMTESGIQLTDEQCKEIMDMSVLSCTEDEERLSGWERTTAQIHRPKHHLGSLIQKEEFVERYVNSDKSGRAEEIERIKLRAERKKTALEHGLDDLRGRIKTIKQGLTANSSDRLAEYAVSKDLKELEKDMRGKEQNLFFEQMKIDVATEEEIAALEKKQQYSATVWLQFVVKIKGAS